MWAGGRGAAVLRRATSPMLSCGWRRSVASTSAEKAAASHATSERTGIYGVQGYEFVEGFRVLGPGAALIRLKAALSVYGLLGATAASCVAYYLATRSYELTTDPDPYAKTRLQYFASDYAVLQNRWTGSRRVVALSDDAANAGAAKERDHPKSSESLIATRRIHVNWLLYRVRLYLHATDSAVVVDLGADMDPYRFAVKRGRRPATAAEGAAGVGNSATARVLYRSRLRPAMTRNEYQRGSLPVYERTLETVTREVFQEKYRRAILSRAASRLSPAFAEEFLRSGALNGEGMSWADVVPDTAAFSAEVRQRVEKKLADQVILLQVDMTVL
ncbi:uncharacterized protein Tco025E_00599 [Trypanosoma conorhini]|uniref:Uncharacterized protein n=1 Tax=Trypanosoma conorhini TaxID=83891 RepID=A0A3R7M5W5_9TRYP|nr:uncharacterized protein Tco025E_00599 [Trypanosoma conorhini]RNF27162.1 hypothetical protein Tco025E_00599 [Trypanosoma conorhini]